jgi:transposase-like protein
MPMRGAPYPPEFREEAVRLFHSSEKSFPQLAKELGIADESLRRWVRQAEIDQGGTRRTHYRGARGAQSRLSSGKLGS